MFRKEIHNPIFARNDYECLNGQWEFENNIRVESINCSLGERIEVPFCPEAKLSGVKNWNKSFGCMYSRRIEVGEKSLDGRLVLHFGAVDYKADVYVNGRFCISHSGGYVPFEVDIAPFCIAGENRITVCVTDNVTDNVPSGKQTASDKSYGCFYTRSTGIWQPVWLERTPRNYLRSVKFIPDIHRCSVSAEVRVEGEGTVGISVSYKGRQVGCASGNVSYRRVFDIPLSEKHLWEIGHGRLYDVELTYGDDKVTSYFGLREARYEGNAFFLNDRKVFQRLVLDQGYYRDGVYTAPTDDMLRNDIVLAQNLGFNGSRLHQKIFEPRFLYHCDKLGHMVWAEFPGWGVEYFDLDAIGAFTGEWVAEMERDFNHPSIITWCPLNETWESLSDGKKTRDVRFVDAIYSLTKSIDGTRPVIDVSGGYHGHHTDFFDFHCYTTARRLKEIIGKIENGNDICVDCVYAENERGDASLRYKDGQPLNISEFGGISYSKIDSKGWTGDGSPWGYTSRGDETGFAEEYERQVSILLGCKKLSGFCYTQLYDIEQEQNGLYDYNRNFKFGNHTMNRIIAANVATAAIEKDPDDTDITAEKTNGIGRKQIN